MELKKYQFWFCTGSQDLYGDECLAKVAQHSKQIVDELNKSGKLPYEVVWKPTLITNELIRKTFNEANADENCAGVITWMHTFSPAKSWILGLQEYRKPLMHLHTQFNEELPYDSIDMDFMNENQSAHGDREYGHIVSRMRIERKVVVGHWSDPVVVDKIASWMRTAVGIMESSHIRVMRVADNMRNVAVTEGDKVEAQIKFRWEVDAYPVNEIAESVAAVSQSDTNALVDEYYDKYDILLEGRAGRVQEACCCTGTDRAWIREILTGEELSGNRNTLRRSRRAAAASGTCNPETYGKRLWIRRRGRLESSRYGTSYEGYDSRDEGCKRNFHAGRLYI